MDRLDDVVGPGNWEDSFVETAKGRTICTLKIRVDGEWISKSDGAGDTDVEGEKGSLSDSLKRAAVKWGIGRYLYNLKDVWAPCESAEYNNKLRWRRWKPEASRVFGDALRSISVEVVRELIDDATRDEIAAMASGAGVPLKKICDAYGISNLKELPASVVGAVKQRIQQVLEDKKNA